MSIYIYICKYIYIYTHVNIYNIYMYIHIDISAISSIPQRPSLREFGQGLARPMQQDPYSIDAAATDDAHQEGSQGCKPANIPWVEWVKARIADGARWRMVRMSR